MSALDSLCDAADRLRAQRERYLQMKYGITEAQYRVLRLLAEADTNKLSMSELAGKIRCTPGNITGIVDRLDQGGFVVRERNAMDRRAVHVCLTASAEQYVRSIVADVTEWERQWDTALQPAIEILSGILPQEHKEVVA